MRNGFSNSFNFFVEQPCIKPTEILAKLDQSIAQKRQELLHNADPATRAKLQRLIERIKPYSTENYLRAFIKDFANQPQFRETIIFYRHQLTCYRRAKNQAAIDALTPTIEQQMTPEPDSIKPNT